MNNTRYEELAKQSLLKGHVEPTDIRWILESPEVELLPLLQAAYSVRREYFSNKVKIHVINNVKNGNCTENCAYCAQSKFTENSVEAYPMKEREVILEDAKKAFEGGTYRYCMVFSGSLQNKKDMAHICGIAREIKERYAMETCVSAGFLDAEKVEMLKAAGVNRYNHNLNTSRNHYGRICTSHDYSKRLNTIKLARSKGLDVCSGVIIGMGETIEDIIGMTGDLRAVDVKSVPINFFIPVEGNRIEKPNELSPAYCLKILCVFRFMLPSAEIRAAGGREHHLRDMQALALYPANSLFAQGYLTSGGDDLARTKQMILDAGFVVDRVE